MSNAQLKTEYQKHTIERLLKLKAGPELSDEARAAIDEVLASRPEYDPGVIEEWERRGDVYRRATRWLWAVVLLGGLPSVPAALLLLPERFANPVIFGLSLVLTALFLVHAWYARRTLTCPNCGRVPLHDSERSVYFAGLKCAFCGKFLGPGGLGSSFKRTTRRVT